MRKILLMAGLVLLITSTELTAQVLNWSSSFSPPWANGNTNRTATNVAGTGVNINVTSVITGGGSYGLSPSAAQTPTVSGATFIVPGSAERLQLNTDFATNSSAVTITITFSTLVRQVSFRLADIDKNSASATSYFDRATITGFMGSLLDYSPSITKYDGATDPSFLQLGSRTATVNSSSGQAGNTASDLTDQRGTITVGFGSTIINKVVIVYDNAPGADADPAAQDFAIGNVSFQLLTLPVNLVAFSAAQSGNDVHLNWTTAQESNSSHFAVERSINVSDWWTIGTITARGNTNERTNYTYTDINPEKATLFYRLKQVDQDGNFTYSSVARISNKDLVTEIVTYPNPFNTQVNISLHSAAAQQVTSSITDITGRVVQSVTRQLSKGNNLYSMNVSEKLPAGIYRLHITDEQKNVIGQARLFKQ